MRRTLVTAIALVLAGNSMAVSATVAGDGPAASSAEVTTQLPRTARPSHYAIEVTPHADKMTFDGKVRIDIDVLAPTSTIVLQAANLTFANSTLVAKGGKPQAANVSVDA